MGGLSSDKRKYKYNLSRKKEIDWKVLNSFCTFLINIYIKNQVLIKYYTFI